MDAFKNFNKDYGTKLSHYLSPDNHVTLFLFCRRIPLVITEKYWQHWCLREDIDINLVSDLSPVGHVNYYNKPSNLIVVRICLIVHTCDLFKMTERGNFFLINLQHFLYNWKIFVTLSYYEYVIIVVILLQTQWFQSSIFSSSRPRPKLKISFFPLPDRPCQNRLTEIFAENSVFQIHFAKRSIFSHYRAHRCRQKKKAYLPTHFQNCGSGKGKQKYF